MRAARPCVTSKNRTGRPYYQSSKEQYELLTSVVRHFLPDASLSKESLRHIVAQLPANVVSNPPSQIPAVLRDEDVDFENDVPGFMRLSPLMESPPSPCPDVDVESQAVTAPSHLVDQHARDALHVPLPQAHAVSKSTIISTSASIPNVSTYTQPRRQSNDTPNPSPAGSAQHTVASHANETFPVESITRKDVMEITRMLQRLFVTMLISAYTRS